MFKKSVLVAIIILAAVGILIYLSMRVDQTKVSETVVQSPPISPKPRVEKTATLFFAPSTLNLLLTDKAPYAIDIMLDAGSASVSGVQAEIKYDPSIISLAKITPATDSLFGPNAVNLINDIDPINGASVFAVGIPSGGTPKSGSGKIATITFNVLSSASPSTEIRLLDTSIVTKLGEKNSILKGTTRAIVNIPPGLRVFVNPTTPNTSIFTPTSIPTQ